MRGLLRTFAVLLIGAVALTLPSPAHAQLWTESGEKWFSEIPDIAVSGSYGILLTNEGTTGTANTLLACYAAGGLAITCPASSTLEVLGPVLKDGGTTGKAVIASIGIAGGCQFDGATTAGNYVQLSTTVDGNCHDVGALFPTSGGRVIGTAVTTNGASGVYPVHMYPRGIQAAKEVTGLVTADVTHAQSNTTLANVTGLAFTGCTTSTEIWYFEVSLLLNVPTTTADWKFGWTYPPGASAVIWGATSADPALDHWGNVGAATTPNAPLAAASTLVHGSRAGDHLLHLRGLLTCSDVNPGLLQLQFAQNTSEASTNTVRKGSMLIARKVVP